MHMLTDEDVRAERVAELKGPATPSNPDHNKDGRRCPPSSAFRRARQRLPSR